MDHLASVVPAAEVSTTRISAVAVELGERPLELVASRWNRLFASRRRPGRPTVVNNDSRLRSHQSAIRAGDDASVDIEVDPTHVLAAALRFVLRPVRTGAVALEDIDVVGMTGLTVDGVDADSKQGNVHIFFPRSTESGSVSRVGLETLCWVVTVFAHLR
jgi:hypothetical protein